MVERLVGGISLSIVFGYKISDQACFSFNNVLIILNFEVTLCFRAKIEICFVYKRIKKGYEEK